MRKTNCELLSDRQVARIDSRCKAIGLSSAALRSRFVEALQAVGCGHSISSARMRLDRVLNPRMRRPLSEETKTALAGALGWTLKEFDQEVYSRSGRGRKLWPRFSVGADSSVSYDSEDLQKELRRVARLLQSEAEVLNSLAVALATKTR